MTAADLCRILLTERQAREPGWQLSDTPRMDAAMTREDAEMARAEANAERRAEYEIQAGEDMP